jgi:hypothetical protein
MWVTPLLTVRAGWELALPLGLLFWYTKIMKRAISVHQKGPGHPPTGRDPALTARLPAKLIQQIEQWAKKNKVASRSEAVRQLLEKALADHG